MFYFNLQIGKMRHIIFFFNVLIMKLCTSVTTTLIYYKRSVIARKYWAITNTMQTDTDN